MNFDFPDELKDLREAARQSLARLDTRAATRAALEGRPDATLWPKLAQLGWPGAGIPERWGGLGLGPLAVCMLAEEVGFAVAPVPFLSSVYLATEALLACGSQAQQDRWLPQLADGSLLASFALAEDHGAIAPARIEAQVRGGRLRGTKVPVPDGGQARLAVVVAPDEEGRWLHLVDLQGPDVAREPVATLDESRPQARIRFEGAPCEPLAGGWDAVRGVLDRAAVLLAFEQLGGAQAALEMARDYALQRHAFGRPIASFQAIKHKLADVYVAIELARSNAYYGAWALNGHGDALPAAAAAARIGATEAAWLATRENVQTHGGMGYTWELDCHLYYRRARVQAQALGGAREWKRRLMDAISPGSERHGS